MNCFDGLSNFVDVKNSFHTSNMNVVSLLYELSGAASGLKLSKMFSRTDHMCSFSLVWMFMCFLRVDDSEKLFPH